MRFKLFTILFFSGLVGFASTPKEDAQQKLLFGINEFTTILSYNNESTSLQIVSEKLSKHFSHLEKRQPKYKTETQFVEYAFYYIHNKLLKKYSEYASINQTIESGAYDCVTGTAIYALFFTELAIPYSVIETNYHIYVLVFPGTENEVLVETTDPIGGFITSPQEIEARKQLYAQSNTETQEGQVNLAWDVQASLKGTELMGVLIFNQSIKQYNLGNKEEAIQLATEALSYYASNRIRTYLNFVKGNQFASN